MVTVLTERFLNQGCTFFRRQSTSEFIELHPTEQSAVLINKRNITKVTECNQLQRPSYCANSIVTVEGKDIMVTETYEQIKSMLQ